MLILTYAIVDSKPITIDTGRLYNHVFITAAAGMLFLHVSLVH